MPTSIENQTIMSSRRAKVLMVGPVSGRLRLLSSKIHSLQTSKAGPFDVCLCVGPFFYQTNATATVADGGVSDETVDLDQVIQDGQDLINGSLSFDLPVLFVDAGDGIPQSFQTGNTDPIIDVLKKDEGDIALDDMEKDEDEIEIDLDLGDAEGGDGNGKMNNAESDAGEGDTTNAPDGLRRIAHNLYQLVGDSQQQLGSIADIVNVPIPMINSESAVNGTSITIGFLGPKACLPGSSFEEKTKQSSFVGCDVLLSGEWAHGMASDTSTALSPGDKNAIIPCVESTASGNSGELGSFDVAKFVMMSRPRYHVAPGPTVISHVGEKPKLRRRFVASLPYCYPSSSEVSCGYAGRFLAMGSVATPSELRALGKEFKFIHAVGFAPVSCMDPNEPVKESKVVDCPYTSGSKRARDGEDGSDGNNQGAKRQAIEATIAVPQADITDNNPSVMNTSVSHQIGGLGAQLQQLGHKIDALGAKFDGRPEDKTMLDLYRENSHLQSTQMKVLQEENVQLKVQIRQLSQKLAEANVKLAEANVTQVQLAQSPAPASQDHTMVQDQMVLLGTPSEQPTVGDVKVRKKHVGGVTVKIELHRLWDEGILKEKKESCLDNEIFPRRALFDRSHDLFVGLHPAFARVSEGKAYQNGMTLVAMSMKPEQWEAIRGGDLDERTRTRIFGSVQEQTLDLAYQLEMETMVRNENSPKSRSKATIHSLGGRFKKICEGWRQMGKSEKDIRDFITEKTGGSDM